MFSSEICDTNHKKPTASVCSLVKWICDTNHKKHYSVCVFSSEMGGDTQITKNTYRRCSVSSEMICDHKPISLENLQRSSVFSSEICDTNH